GSGVETIGVSAFEGCENLASVTIPSSVTSIGDYAFYYNTSLTRVTIGSDVETIGVSAFEGCENLGTVTIGAGVEMIGDYAFWACSDLVNITFSGSPPELGSYVFYGVGSNAIAYYEPTNATDWDATFGGLRTAVVGGTLNVNIEGTTFETAIALTSVTGGFGADGNISVPYQKNYYTFRAAATGLLLVSLDQINDSGVDTYLRIYDSSNQIVPIAEDDDSGDELNSLASVSVVQGYDYFIEASAYGSGIGEYQVLTRVISTAGSGNPFASGNSFEDAISIAINPTTGVASVEGNISAPYSLNYYTFLATSTSEISVSMDAINNSGIDTYLSIYDSNPILNSNPILKKEDDNSGTALNSLVTFSVEAGKIYYVVASANGSGTGSYRIATTYPISGPGGYSFDTALSISPNNVTKIASAVGDISVEGEEVFYKYVAYASGVVDFSMVANGNSSVDTYLSIYDSNRILKKEDDDSGTALNSLASGVSVRVNETYYIKAATAYGTGTGAYTVFVSAISRPEIGAFGNPFVLGTNADGNISVAGEEDFYKYTAYANGVVDFAMVANGNSGVDPYIRLLDSNGIQKAENDDSSTGLNSLVSFSVEVDKIYYVVASFNGSGKGAYMVSATFKIADDVGNNLDATATSLSFTNNVASQSNKIELDTDVDVFCLTADVEGVYEIKVRPANASALGLDPVIEVIKNDGTTLLEFSSSNAGVAAFALPFLTLGQQVYVRVSGAGTTGDYTLEVTKPTTATDFIANIFNPLPMMLQQVDLITLSQGTNSGSLSNNRMVIESATDVDVFSFTANRSGPIQVSVSKAVGSNLDTIISILDASGNVIASNDNSGASTNSEVVIDVNNRKVYYVSVSGYGGTTGGYRIDMQDLTPVNLSFDGDGVENDFTKATSLGFVNGVASAASEISAVGDRDVFKIVATANGLLAFSLQARANSGLDSYLYLYDANENLLAQDNDNGSGVDSLINWAVHKGEIYYLQAAPFGASTGAYTVSATISAGDDHADLVGDSATRLIVSDNVVVNTAGTIDSSTDDDVFSFVATDSGSITISVSANATSALDTYLYAYNSTGNILLAYNNDISSTNRNSKISIQVIAKEKYYFMVSGYGTSLG
ncbi:MAG: leucine-rich repeat protein, partial [Planctomycetota bacterium]